MKSQAVGRLLAVLGSVAAGAPALWLAFRMIWDGQVGLNVWGGASLAFVLAAATVGLLFSRRASGVQAALGLMVIGTALAVPSVAFLFFLPSLLLLAVAALLQAVLIPPREGSASR